MHRPRTIAALLLAAACSPRPAPGESATDTSTGAASETGAAPTTGATATDGAPTGADASTTASTGATQTASTSAGVPDEPGFLAKPDVAPPGFPDCNLAEPDCPDGFKCNPAGHNPFIDPPQCVPLVPDARPHGAPCSMFGDGTTGADDCDAGVVCLFPDAEGHGVCHALCNVEGGTSPGPDCARALTCFGPLCQSCFWGYCDVECDPRMLDACDAGRVCGNLANTWWGCITDSSGDAGQVGDPCQFANACDPGHFCMNADQVVGCTDGTGCCAPLCATDQPNTCPGAAQGEQCIPWYAQGEAPPHLTTLGVCAVPL